ncbi:MAG: Ig-like domain-containing protein [Thiohalospira sp.]
MRKKFTLLMSFLLVAFFTFAQEWQAVEKTKTMTEKEKALEKEGPRHSPYLNAVDGIKVSQKAKENKDTNPVVVTDSPGQFEYNSNTLTELDWETFTVPEAGLITEIQIDYTWTTDSYASEGSFHIESPSGTSAVIASGDADGVYQVILTDFEGEAMDGDWDIWIQDSWGDGGHQATDITVTFTFDPPPANDAGISEILSFSEDEITYEGEKDMVVQLKNSGTDDLTSVTIDWGYILDEDSTFMDPINWTGSLAQGETEEINLGTITLESGNTYQIGAMTSMPNGVEDENVVNDGDGVEIDVYKKGSLIESFEGSAFPPKNWVIVNNDEGAQTWMHDNSYSFDGDYSASVRWENSTITNDDWLITPKLLVEEGDELSFWARSTSSGSYSDDFNVLVSKTGNEVDDFSIVLDEVTSPSYDWSQYSYTLTDNANIAAGDEIYIAIQYSALNQLRLVVDMFTGPMLADLENDDVEVNEITTSMLQPGEENMLEAVVQNVGLNDQTAIEVTFKVDGTEVGSTTIESLTYQESATASINWTAPGEPGKYTVEAFVADDDNNENNMATKNVWSLTEQTAYVNDYMAGEFQSITLPYSQEIEVISSTATSYYAGTWALGKWYAVSENGDLVTVNSETGNTTTIGTLDLNSVTGITYDWSSNTMYAMNYNDEDEISELYTIDLQTAEVNRVGLGSTPGININLACDLEGNLYSMNISDDKLYAISKTAGAGTPVGDLGIDISYAQDMEFDHANGDILYAAAYVDDGGLYVIDTETGAASLLGPFTGGNELGALAIPYYSPIPQVAEKYPLANSEDNAIDTDIYVIFDQNVDSVDFSGITITGQNSGEVANVVATHTDSMITITHDPLANDDVFTVTIPAGAVTAEEPNEEITWSFGTIMAAPEYSVLSPVNEAEGIALDAEISVVFNQEITNNNLASVTMEGTVQGAVTGVNASVNPDGKTVVITHDDFTEYEDTIVVTIPANAVENEDGVTNSEIVWEFYLMKEGQPVADSLAPANNQTGVDLDADVLIRFDTEVAEGDLSGMVIEGATEGAVANVVATLTDSTIHIAHDAFANNNELYTVTIPAGAVTSVATSEPNAEIKWNFTSIKTAPQLVEMTPADGATMVALDQDIIFSFDQKVMTDYDLDTLITIIGENEDTVQNLNTVLNGDQMGFTVSHDDMEYNSALYTVTIPAEVVYNSDEVMNAEEVSWTFTTIMAAPEAETTTPEDGAVDVALDADVSITFDQEITENDLGVISIESEAMGNVPNVVATLADDNKTINIAHDDFFTVNEDTYTVTIPASTVMNTDGVYNPELYWSFQTVYTYDITFLVKEGNTPVADATVMLFGKEATTDATGVAVIEAVYEGGPYEYSVAKSGYKTETGTINVSGIATIAIDFESAYKVTFNVTDGADPIEDATVHFEGEILNTDTDGAAEFIEVEPGVKPYIVMKDGYNDKTGTLEIVDANITKNIVLDLLTGINDLAKQGITIYPNPSNGVFYINNETDEKMQLMIMDVAGRFVVNKTLYNSINTIDISDQSSGIYIIQLTRGEDTYNSKIILK